VFFFFFLGFSKRARSFRSKQMTWYCSVRKGGKRGRKGTAKSTHSRITSWDKRRNKKRGPLGNSSRPCNALILPLLKNGPPTLATFDFNSTSVVVGCLFHTHSLHVALRGCRMAVLDVSTACQPSVQRNTIPKRDILRCSERTTRRYHR